MIKILIADDHPVVRKGLKEIIVETPGMEVLAEATRGNEALEKALKQDFDVIILDISMPGRNGIETLKEIKKQKPLLPVLILSIHPEEHYAVRALKAGAAGYLTKESAPNELVKAIQQVNAGNKYFSASLVEKLVFDLDLTSEKPLYELLSDREFEILCRIASGKTISEIAKELCLSVKTISTYRSRILEKMRMATNAELTHYAIRNKLVD